MEVSPKPIDLTTRSHAVENIVCSSCPPLDAHIISSEDFIGFHVAGTIEIVDNPFIEMVAPVREGVGELSSRLTLSVEAKKKTVRGGARIK